MLALVTSQEALRVQQYCLKLVEQLELPGNTLDRVVVSDGRRMGPKPLPDCVDWAHTGMNKRLSIGISIWIEIQLRIYRDMSVGRISIRF